AQLLIPLPPTTDGRDKKSRGKSYNIMTEENLNRLLITKQQIDSSSPSIFRKCNPDFTNSEKT
ncbi:hypothetical protein, partial [Bacteroides acidifaciens]|uniref:hypothetical protein n=1 Tax=Bacteroides acidifaciens TaxID=85831 RepID=UPI00258F2BD7